jgi:hypothetical protein
LHPRQEPGTSAENSSGKTIAGIIQAGKVAGIAGVYGKQAQDVKLEQL